MRIAAQLIAVDVRLLRNSLVMAPDGRRRLVILGLLAVFFVLGVYGGAHWFFSRSLEIEPIGELVVRRALGMVLLVVYSLLAFSSLIGAFSTLYLDGDLQLLVSRPVPVYPLYAARFVKTCVVAAWMVFPFSLPIFIAAGIDLEAETGYYATLGLVYVSMAVIPCAVGMILSLLLTSVVSARRARHVVIVLGSLTLGVLVFLVRKLEPEKLMNPDEGVPLIEALQAMQGLDPPWLPSSWALDALWSHLGWSLGASTHPVGLLFATALMSFFVTGWVFRWLHPRAFSRAQEGLRRESGARPGGGSSLSDLVAAGVKDHRHLSFARCLRWKDRLVFIRDSAQWAQMLILAAIVAIYVLNFKYIRVVAGSGLVSDLGLHFLNLGLCAFVTIALAARFVFPSVSLEGRAFWLVLSSPNSMSAFLRAKVWAWFMPLAAFANFLMMLTHFFVGADRALLPFAFLTITPMAFGLVGLGIGLGARFPRFGADNAVAVTTGLGGVMFMLTSAVLAVVVTLVAVLPTVACLKIIRHGRMLGPVAFVIAGVCAVAVVLLPLLASRQALRIGRRYLEEGGG